MDEIYLIIKSDLTGLINNFDDPIRQEIIGYLDESEDDVKDFVEYLNHTEGGKVEIRGYRYPNFSYKKVPKIYINEKNL